MDIKVVTVGNLMENCYILSIEDEAVVIDPGDEIEKIKKEIKDKKVIRVLLTHRHFDHIGALSYFDKSIIYDHSNLEEKRYNISKFNFEVIYTSGHTSDSISFYFYEYNILFSGDFIFYENIGRCDLPTGSVSNMQKSIAKIKKYDNNMTIYPGHGRSTTLKHEIEKNIYF